MAKIPLLTDIHIGARNDSPYFNEIFLSFFENQFLPYILENNHKTIFILGDLFERRKYINFNTLYQAKKRFFQALKDHDIQTILIIGNHDVYFKNTNEVNSPELLLAEYDNIKIIKEKDIVNVDGTDIGFISWVNNENLQDSIDWIKNLNARVLCGHFDIKTFEMVRGHFSTTGFEMNLFERFELVLSGHFHIRATQNNITYIGNPNQTNWSDYGYQRGFAILDTDTLKLDYIDNIFNVYEVIKFKDIKFDEYDIESCKNKIVKIYIEKLGLLEQKQLDLFVESLQKVAASVEITETSDELRRIEDDKQIDIETDTISLIRSYIFSVEESNISKDTLMDYFVEIYNESLQLAIDEK